MRVIYDPNEIKNMPPHAGDMVYMRGLHDQRCCWHRVSKVWRDPNTPVVMVTMRDGVAYCLYNLYERAEAIAVKEPR